MSVRSVAVVGGGMAGVAAAHRLVGRARAEHRALDVVLLEATRRLGGTIETEHAGGFTIERGADAFITEKPWALALCERLGLSDRLIGTCETDRRTYVAHGGRLLPLPEGFLLLAPTDLRALAMSPLFSWPGKLRMALDLVLPRRRSGGDESLGHFVRRRLGREAFERAADPLVGGIYTADADRLSLAATMPRFLELERRHRSLILGLRAAARTSPAAANGAGARYGLFVSHADGMGALVGDVARQLPEGIVQLGAPVEGVAREQGTWRLRAGGEPLAVDALVLATPAHVTAGLLAASAPALAADVGTIEYASSATVTLGYRGDDVAATLRGFGFVVPATAGRPLLACSYTSRKFAGRAPAGHELLRAFVGGARRPDLADLPAESLVELVRRELRALVGITADPVLVRVHHHPRAMAQYAVGHLARVAAIEARTPPRLALAGGAYRGVGIPDCVRSGEAAADAVLEDRRA